MAQSQPNNEKDESKTLTRRELFEGTFSGAIDRPRIPLLRSDPHPLRPPPRTLEAFREAEGRESRKQRLRELWHRLQETPLHPRSKQALKGGVIDQDNLTHEQAESLRTMYADELIGRCGTHPEESNESGIKWKAFKEYAEAKEVGEVFILPPNLVQPLLHVANH